MRYVIPLLLCMGLVVLMAGSGPNRVKVTRSIGLMIAGTILLAAIFTLAVDATLR